MCHIDVARGTIGPEEPQLLLAQYQYSLYYQTKIASLIWGEIIHQIIHEKDFLVL